jgi:hypothetical protein
MSDRPRLPLYPTHPERICWGCPRYCPAAELACGNGSIRAPHPIELFGDDWLEVELDVRTPTAAEARGPSTLPR